VQSSMNSFEDFAQYRSLTPFVLAIAALLAFASRKNVQART